MHDTIFVGMDVHKATISVAVAGGARGEEVRHLGNFLNRLDHVDKLVQHLSKTDGQRRLRFCYEAGPCGYGLHRRITDLGHECVVVAPSLIPVKAGDRIKTDRRDAVMLAKLHRAGELSAVWAPDAAHEAMRDLIRARATAARVLANARQHGAVHASGAAIGLAGLYRRRDGCCGAGWSADPADRGHAAALVDGTGGHSVAGNAWSCVDCCRDGGC